MGPKAQIPVLSTCMISKLLMGPNSHREWWWGDRMWMINLIWIRNTGGFQKGWKLDEGDLQSGPPFWTSIRLILCGVVITSARNQGGNVTSWGLVVNFPSSSVWHKGDYPLLCLGPRLPRGYQFCFTDRNVSFTTLTLLIMDGYPSFK
jgi:hypothetical protein